MPRISAYTDRMLTGVGMPYQTQLQQPTPPADLPAIGTLWASQGGYYAGPMSFTGSGIITHYIVMHPKENLPASIDYSSTVPLPAGMLSVIDGLSNTNALTTISAPAAVSARALTTGGFTDWYIPAIYEADIIYRNLKTINDLNYVLADGIYSMGTNPYAVPTGAAYTTTVPAQTTATAFKTGGSQAVADSIWSSTRADSTGMTVASTFPNTSRVFTQTWGYKIFGTGNYGACITQYGQNTMSIGQYRPIRKVAA